MLFLLNKKNVENGLNFLLFFHIPLTNNPIG